MSGLNEPAYLSFLYNDNVLFSRFTKNRAIPLTVSFPDCSLQNISGERNSIETLISSVVLSSLHSYRVVLL